MVEATVNTVASRFTYNGDGVRVAQRADGIETRWVQDTVSLGLPQVLVESANSKSQLYVYGLGRLAQVEDGEAEWFLTDALGSVRQVVDEDGDIVLARDYSPYGQLLAESGTGSSGYGYTGEQYDRYIDMVFLRARWYDVQTGRFVSQDPWTGSIQQPSSLHKFLYVADNPVNFVDPSGLIEEGEADRAREIIRELDSYSVIIREDFGWQGAPIPPHIDGMGSVVGETTWTCGRWIEGNWKSVWELEQVRAGVIAMANSMGGSAQFSRKVGKTLVRRGPDRYAFQGNTNIWGNITYYKYTFDDINNPGQRRNNVEVRNTVVHEFAHAWDTHNEWRYSMLMKKVTGSKRVWGKYEPGGSPTGINEDLLPRNAIEDWAESVAYVLFPQEDWLPLGLTRRTFVRNAFTTQSIEALESVYAP